MSILKQKATPDVFQYLIPRIKCWDDLLPASDQLPVFLHYIFNDQTDGVSRYFAFVNTAIRMCSD